MPQRGTKVTTAFMQAKLSTIIIKKNYNYNNLY
jgi:hypothetical protein